MSFKSQKEIWEHLIAGGKLDNGGGSFLHLSRHGEVVDELNNPRNYSFKFPHEWQIYQEPKPKRKVTLCRFTVKMEQSGEIVQTLWAQSFYEAVKYLGRQSCVSLSEEIKEIEIDT